ncbi:MAG: hypothetical protein GTO63_19395 [Anaerolineae bacterium]|nr:hypothetical protein [Anaerolineae bacterium]NIN96939.1 hypothetical protein [Anaerolineae bacterium]NIQ79900.1 hypothetical protein [Anaerolineae bacterium]
MTGEQLAATLNATVLYNLCPLRVVGEVRAVVTSRITGRIPVSERVLAAACQLRGF